MREERENKRYYYYYFFKKLFPGERSLFTHCRPISSVWKGVGRCGQLRGGGNEQRVVAARLAFIISCAAAIIHRANPEEERGAVNETHIRIESKQFQ